MKKVKKVVKKVVSKPGAKYSKMVSKTTKGKKITEGVKVKPTAFSGKLK